jgi:hypothetical protein
MIESDYPSLPVPGSPMIVHNGPEHDKRMNPLLRFLIPDSRFPVF